MTRFVDLELAMLDVAAPLVGGSTHVGLVTPSDLEQRLPFHRIYRLPGADDGITDEALVVVDTFAATRALVFAAAEDLRQALIWPGYQRTTDGVLDSVRTIAAPAATPEQPSGFRRYSATYQVRARRRVAA